MARGKATAEPVLVETPGHWNELAPGHYEWVEGTHQDLDDRHEYPHKIHRLATGLTTEFGTWEFSGPPPIPAGGIEGKKETPDDIRRAIADLQARLVKAENE